MDEEDLINSIGTLAKSGTKAYIEHLKKSENDSNLIGQFGVGFIRHLLLQDSRCDHQKTRF